MKIPVKDFCYDGKREFKISEAPTKVEKFFSGNEDFENQLNIYKDAIFDLQNMMYAHDRYALLLIFQGMDTAGKDGAIKHVMSGINPSGVQVFSFKKPSLRELDHNFLWRTNYRMPERGRIGIFNRSYYEEVLVVKVHPEILHSQRIPSDRLTMDENFWQTRYTDIKNMEQYLANNGTRVVKFFIHISKDEQRKRFLKRIDKPEKNWKLSKADIAERQFWNQYQKAYEDCINCTATGPSPWHVIPGDNKKNARLIVSQIVLKTIKELKIHYPKPEIAHEKELREIREQLVNES